MGASEGLKDYAQKWRDLAGRVQPPLADRELANMFLGTLFGPYFNHLIGSSSSGFTELIMTGRELKPVLRAARSRRVLRQVQRRSLSRRNLVQFTARGAKTDLGTAKKLMR